MATLDSDDLTNITSIVESATDALQQWIDGSQIAQTNALAEQLTAVDGHITEGVELIVAAVESLYPGGEHELGADLLLTNYTDVGGGTNHTLGQLFGRLHELLYAAQGWLGARPMWAPECVLYGYIPHCSGGEEPVGLGLNELSPDAIQEGESELEMCERLAPTLTWEVGLFTPGRPGTSIGPADPPGGGWWSLEYRPMARPGGAGSDLTKADFQYTPTVGEDRNALVDLCAIVAAIPAQFGVELVNP